MVNQPLSLLSPKSPFSVSLVLLWIAVMTTTLDGNERWTGKWAISGESLWTVAKDEKVWMGLRVDWYEPGGTRRATVLSGGRVFRRAWRWGKQRGRSSCTWLGKPPSPGAPLATGTSTDLTIEYLFGSSIGEDADRALRMDNVCRRGPTHLVLMTSRGLVNMPAPMAATAPKPNSILGVERRSSEERDTRLLRPAPNRKVRITADTWGFMNLFVLECIPVGFLTCLVLVLRNFFSSCLLSASTGTISP